MKKSPSKKFKANSPAGQMVECFMMWQKTLEVWKFVKSGKKLSGVGFFDFVEIMNSFKGLEAVH